jgi:hypothetical protein
MREWFDTLLTQRPRPSEQIWVVKQWNTPFFHHYINPLMKIQLSVPWTCGLAVPTLKEQRSHTELSQPQREIWLNEKNLTKLGSNFNVKMTIHTPKGWISTIPARI